MTEKEIEALRSELAAIRTGLFEAWKIYMSWYTWFFGANLFVLGWFFTGNKSPGGANIIILAIAWCFFNILGTATSLKLREYTLEASSETKQLAETFNNSVEWAFHIKATASFPERLGALAATFNALALTVNVAMWIYVSIRFS